MDRMRLRYLRNKEIHVYDRYQEYVLTEVEAEKETDPEKQTEIKKAARSSFEEWMDLYHVENG